LSAGFAALAPVFVVGKRVIVSGEKGGPHTIALVALGTGLLWFGWFGFNSGSALAANGVAATAFVNTDIAASVAMVVCFALSWARDGKPSMTGALTGAVAGPATVTPAAGYVPSWAAAIIGLLASVVCYLAIQFRIKQDWDDALDVWGVHGVGGALGVILTGVFASAAVNGVSGLVEGNVNQFVVQVFAVMVMVLYSLLVTFGILKTLNLFEPVRVSAEIEAQGLDQIQLGETGYDRL
jgi:Amt family ammonium transporter